MSDILDSLDATNPKHQELILSHLIQAIKDLIAATEKQTQRITELEIAYRHEQSVRSVKAPIYRNWWQISKFVLSSVVIIFVAGTLYQDFKTKPAAQLDKLNSKIGLILDMHNVKHEEQ